MVSFKTDAAAVPIARIRRGKKRFDKKMLNSIWMAIGLALLPTLAAWWFYRERSRLRERLNRLSRMKRV